MLGSGTRGPGSKCVVCGASVVDRGMVCGHMQGNQIPAAALPQQIMTTLSYSSMCGIAGVIPGIDSGETDAFFLEFEW